MTVVFTTQDEFQKNAKLYHIIQGYIVSLIIFLINNVNEMQFVPATTSTFGSVLSQIKKINFKVYSLHYGLDHILPSIFTSIKDGFS